MLLLCVEGLEAKTMTVDKSGVKPGPVSIREANGALLVDWEDDAGHRWEAVFALDSTEPVIASVSMDGRGVVEGVRRCIAARRERGREGGTSSSIILRWRLRGLASFAGSLRRVRS